MEWFGLPKSLTFNRLRVPTETDIELNGAYLFGCKFDPFTTSLCGAYSLDTLALADCIALLSLWLWVHPWWFGLLSLLSATPTNVLTLVATPEAVASVHSP